MTSIAWYAHREFVGSLVLMFVTVVFGCKEQPSLRLPEWLKRPNGPKSLRASNKTLTHEKAPPSADLVPLLTLERSKNELRDIEISHETEVFVPLSLSGHESRNGSRSERRLWLDGYVGNRV